MNKHTLIDKIRIGLIGFEAYLIEDDNKLQAFAIFLDDSKDPLLLFQKDKKNEKIDITLNVKIADEIQSLKSKDSTVRKEHFKIFQQFVLESEQKAKEMVFKDKRLHYITDVQLLRSIQEAYLID